MEQDIIIELAKRTLTEVKNQVKEIPIVAVPFALWGFLLTPWWLFISLVLLVLVIIAHNEYTDYTNELIMADLQTDTQPDPIAEEVKKQEEQETKE